MKSVYEGRGYVTDTEQIAPNTCFNSVVSSRSGRKSTVYLSSSLKYQELLDSMGYSLTLKGEYESFSGEIKASYMRDIKERESTISINYVNMVADKVTLNILEYGQGALSNFGKAAYNSNSRSDFILTCGDQYITSYAEGALLTFSLYINVYDKDKKQKINYSLSAGYKDIFSAIRNIEITLNTYKFVGEVSIKAFQEGGDPSKLGSILGSKDPSGSYSLLVCDLNNLADCKKAASNLLDYASNIFPAQFSPSGDLGFSVFEGGFINYRNIDLVGLSPVNSILTSGTLLNREKFKNEFYKYDSYYRQLKNIQSLYSDVIKKDTVLAQNIISLIEGVKGTLDKITNPQNGALECYNEPRKCDDVTLLISPVDENKLKVIDYQLQGAYYDINFEKLINSYIVSWDQNSLLYKNLRSLYDKNRQYVDKLKSLNGNFSKISSPDFSLSPISQQDFEFMNPIMNKCQILNRNNAAGTFAYKFTDDPNDKGLSYKKTDGSIYSLNYLKFKPGSSYSFGQSYNDGRNDVTTNCNSVEIISDFQYKMSCSLVYRKGAEGFSLILNTPNSEYYFSYYNNFVLYTNAVIAVKDQKDITCFTGQTCIYEIDFKSIVWNVKKVSFSNLKYEKNGKLVVDSQELALNTKYDLGSAFQYIASNFSSTNQIQYIAYNDAGTQTFSYIDVNVTYVSTSVPSTIAPSTSTPTTSVPSTGAPVTSSSITSVPSTIAPSTSTPTTTVAPSTSATSTMVASTAVPSTSLPTTSVTSTGSPLTSSVPVSSPGSTCIVTINLNDVKNSEITLCNICSNTSQDNKCTSTSTVKVTSTENMLVKGTLGNDYLIGDSQNNIIWGAGGVDTYTGGGGSDTFIIDANSNVTTITDLEMDNINEKIDLRQFYCTKSLNDLDVKSAYGVAEVSLKMELNRPVILLSRVIPIKSYFTDKFIFNLNEGCVQSTTIIPATTAPSIATLSPKANITPISVGAKGYVDDTLFFQNYDSSIMVNLTYDRKIELCQIENLTYNLINQNFNFSIKPNCTYIDGRNMSANIIGSPYPDVLIGDERNNYINGGGGEVDEMTGKGGNNTFVPSIDSKLTIIRDFKKDDIIILPFQFDYKNDLDITCVTNRGKLDFTASSSNKTLLLYLENMRCDYFISMDRVTYIKTVEAAGSLAVSTSNYDRNWKLYPGGQYSWEPLKKSCYEVVVSKVANCTGVVNVFCTDKVTENSLLSGQLDYVGNSLICSKNEGMTLTYYNWGNDLSCNQISGVLAVTSVCPKNSAVIVDQLTYKKPSVPSIVKWTLYPGASALWRVKDDIDDICYSVSMTGRAVKDINCNASVKVSCLKNGYKALYESVELSQIGDTTFCAQTSDLYLYHYSTNPNFSCMFEGYMSKISCSANRPVYINGSRVSENFIINSDNVELECGGGNDVISLKPIDFGKLIIKDFSGNETFDLTAFKSVSYSNINFRENGFSLPRGQNVIIDSDTVNLENKNFKFYGEFNGSETNYTNAPDIVTNSPDNFTTAPTPSPPIIIICKEDYIGRVKCSGSDPLSLIVVFLVGIVNLYLMEPLHDEY